MRTATAWRTLFSTSGCRIKFGTCASSVSALDVVADHQAIAEAGLLDLQVLLEELELVLQRHFLRAALVERDAEQVAQARPASGRRPRRRGASAPRSR